MKLRKYIKLSTVALSLVLSLGACSNATDESNTTTAAEKSATESTKPVKIEIATSKTTEGNDGSSASVETKNPLEEATTENRAEQSTGSSTADNQTETTKKPNGETTKQQETTKEYSTEKEEETTTKKPEISEESDIKAIVDNILNKIIKPGMTELERALAIHDYITYNIDYDYSNYLAGTIPAESYTALGALKTGRAVCAGYALAFYELASAVDLEVKYISGTADNGSGAGYQSHGWNQVKIQGVWYNVDTTWDDPASEGKDENDNMYNGYTYCLVSDATLNKDHKPNTPDIAKCPKDYDAKELAKALANISKDVKSVYADSSTSFDKLVADVVGEGIETFDILSVNNSDDFWDEITSAITKTKKPLWVAYTSGSGNIKKYRIERKEDVYCLTKLTDLKAILDANKSKWNDLEFWYYDNTATEENINQLIDGALYDTGHMVELYARTEIKDGKVEFTIQRPENVLTVSDLTEIATYLKNNTINSLKSKEIWYKATGITNESQINELLAKALIPKGYDVYSYIKVACSNVVKFVISEIKGVYFAENGGDLAKLIQQEGIEKLSTKWICTYNDEASVIVKLLKMQAESNYTLNYSYGEHYNFIIIYVVGIEEDKYISTDSSGLKTDIEAAIGKGKLANSRFWILDTSSQLSEDAVIQMVAATGCPVAVDIVSYYEGQYYEICLRMAE